MVMMRSGPGLRGGKAPGSVPSGRPVPAGRGEGNPSPAAAARRVSPGSWVRAGRSLRDGVSLAVGHRHAPIPSGSPRRPRPGRGPATGPPGQPASSPGRSARLARVASGTVSLAGPATPPLRPPAGPQPPGRPGRGGSPGPAAGPGRRGRGAGPPAVQPAFLSSLARAAIRWSAARIQPGPVRRPSARRCQFLEPPLHPANLDRGSRVPSPSSGRPDTARAIAARNPPGVSLVARSSTSASAPPPRPHPAGRWH